MNNRIKQGTNGVINVDSGTLFVNSVSNNVGINTITPAYTLDVSGTLRIATAPSSTGLIYWEHMDV